MLAFCFLRLEAEQVARLARERIADPADDEADDLQREQRPGDGLQPGRIRSDERIALAHRVDDRQQPLEDEVVQRDRSETVARFAYDRVRDSWTWSIDNDDKGKITPFARVTLTRR